MSNFCGLNGVWYGDDGGIYFIHHYDNEVWWFGASAYLRKLTIVSRSCEPLTSRFRHLNGFAWGVVYSNECFDGCS